MSAPKRKAAGTRPVAIVTGAGRGIGRGIALALAGRGFDVAGLDIVYEPGNKTEGLFEVAATAAKLGTRFLAIRCDIADLAGHDAALDKVVEGFGRIDVLVNNAGIAPEKRARVLEATAASYDRVMAVPEKKSGRISPVGRNPDGDAMAKARLETDSW